MIAQYLRESYDNERCTRAWRELKEVPRDAGRAEEALLSALPVLGILMRRQFRRFTTSSEEYEEVVSTVPTRLYSYLLSDSFYNKHYSDEVRTFSFLWTFFYYEIISILKRVKGWRVPTSGSQAVPVVAYHATTPLCFDATSSATECRVMVAELPKEIKRRCLLRVRFSGDEFDICREIIEARVGELGRTPATPYVALRRRWPGILRDNSVMRFFVDYCRATIREALIEMKPELDRIPTIQETDSSAVRLQEMFTESLRASPSQHFWRGVDTAEAN